LEFVASLLAHAMPLLSQARQGWARPIRNTTTFFQGKLQALL
jgi:hypothetical protein